MPSSPPLFDAHNHLQDSRLSDDPQKLIKSLRAAGIRQCVVNGTCEADWEAVANLARLFPKEIVPSFGLHPWKVGDRSGAWLDVLKTFLAEFPTAGVGEIGLDRWIENADPDAQEEVFVAQLRLAKELDRPCTIHCLKAWGQLTSILEMKAEEKELPRRYLVHSFNGSAETGKQLIKLGAFFSASGYFLKPKKAKQLQILADLPQRRLLLETDAPDMVPPSAYQKLGDSEINHPADFSLIAPALAKSLGGDLTKYQENAREFFGQ